MGFDAEPADRVRKKEEYQEKNGITLSLDSFR
jgi:hypothetical protein